MLKGKNIIVLSDDWGRHPFSCQHLIKNLLPQNRVLWVNSVGYRKIKFTSYDIRRAIDKVISWGKISSLFGRMVHKEENLKILNPICLPFGNISIVRQLNAWSILHLVRYHVSRLKRSDLVLITTLPTAADVVAMIGAECVIYYCVDDFTLWPGADADLMQMLEERLISQVDLVIATSEKLLQTRKCPSGKCELLTHGVDVEHFKRRKVTLPPPFLRNLKPPIVGYYGLIDERCDIHLLFELANGMKDVTFLLIGKWRVSPGNLGTLKNVVRIGPVSYEDLPNYLSAINVLILPYVVNELSESINPLKIKEYLATGLPVVSTALPEVIKLSPFVHIAKGLDEFRKRIVESLNNGQAHMDLINTYLEKESWKIKARQFCIAIENILNLKTNSV